MNTPWRIEMLGWLRAQSGDLTLTRFRTQKTALLLARLAFYPRRAHPREELADLLWPDADRDSGRNRLKQSLAILRRQLEPPGTPAGSVLIADRLSVRLNPAAVFTDVAEFEAALHAKQIEQAATLYQGELLPGFYDDWVIEERERLAALWDEAQNAPTESVPVSVPAALPSALPAAPQFEAQRLPVLFTRFFGRERERAEVAAHLRDPHIRLLTLTGPGGTGKTRLSLEVAHQIAAEGETQVHFVPLADLSDPSLIPVAIADTLRLPRESTTEPLGQIVEALAAAPALLVLDNLEHLGEGAALPVLALLTRVPSLTILATSRSRLFIAGEQEYPLAPLPMPQTEVGGLLRPKACWRTPVCNSSRTGRRRRGPTSRSRFATPLPWSPSATVLRASRWPWNWPPPGRPC